MQLTGLETTLIGTVLGITGLAIGIVTSLKSRVSKDFCKFQHEALEKLLDEKLSGINKNLDELCEIIKTLGGWDGRERRQHGR